MYQDSSGSYLNVGDVVLYGKFKNAKGRIKSFGKNEKGDPTIEVQPIDSDFKPKKGQPKTLTLLKVRKLPKKASARRVVARFLQARGVALGKTWENGKVRIHRYANYFKVWDLTNAGKRGKKVRVMDIGPNMGPSKDKDWLERQSRFILLNARTYDTIKAFYSDLMADFPHDISIDEHQERGVDVIPGGTRKIEVQWKHGEVILDLDATPLEFHLRHSAPLSHHTTGESIGCQDTLYWPRNRTAAKRFYAWLSGEGEGKIKRMGIMDLRKLWREIKVDFEWH